MYNSVLIQCLKNGDINRDEASLLLQNIKRDLLNGGNHLIFFVFDPNLCILIYYVIEG